MKTQMRDIVWIGAAVAGFCGAFAFGYRAPVSSYDALDEPASKADHPPADLPSDGATGQKRLSLEELEQWIESTPSPRLLRNRLKGVDEDTAYRLTTELSSILRDDRRRYGTPFMTLVRRLAELNPEKTLLLCHSLDDSDRHFAFLELGSAIAEGDPALALALMPENEEDRTAFLGGLVSNVPREFEDEIRGLLTGAPDYLAERLADRFDGPSDKLVALTDLNAASEKIAQVDDPSERRAALDKVLGEIASVDFPRALQLIQAHPNVPWTLNSLCVLAPFRLRPRETFLEIMTLPPSESRDSVLLTTLYSPTGIGLDLAGEIAAAIGDQSKRMQAATSFAASMSDADPEAAREFAELYGSAEEFDLQTGRRRLRKQMNDDPEATLEVIDKLDESAFATDYYSRETAIRQTVRNLYLRSEITGNEEALLEKILPFVPPVAEGSQQDDSVREILGKWTERDPDGALHAVLADPRLRGYASDVWAAAASNDPIAVIQRALAGSDRSAAKAAVNSGVESLALRSPEKAIEIVESLLNDPDRVELVGSKSVTAVAKSLVVELSAKEAAIWAASLPDDLSERATGAVVYETYDRNSGQIDAVVQSVPQNPGRDRAFRFLARMVSDADPAQGFGLLLQIPTANRSEYELATALRKWEKIDSEAARAAARAAGVSLSE